MSKEEIDLELIFIRGVEHITHEQWVWMFDLAVQGLKYSQLREKFEFAMDFVPKLATHPNDRPICEELHKFYKEML